MINLSDYREILLKIQAGALKPQYVWFSSFGSFINNSRKFKDKTILDFGCDIESNCYHHFVRTNETDMNYFGFDVSDTIIKWLKDNGLYYDFWNDASRKFDAINASQVYEHLDEATREKFLERSYELLNDGGILYIDIPYIANLNMIEFFRRDRTHKPVACESEAAYIERFGYEVELFVGGYTIPYMNIFCNFYRALTNVLLGYKPFLVTFIIAKKK